MEAGRHIVRVANWLHTLQGEAAEAAESRMAAGPMLHQLYMVVDLHAGFHSVDLAIELAPEIGMVERVYGICPPHYSDGEAREVLALDIGAAALAADTSRPRCNAEFGHQLEMRLALGHVGSDHRIPPRMPGFAENADYTAEITLGPPTLLWRVTAPK